MVSMMQRQGTFSLKKTLGLEKLVEHVNQIKQDQISEESKDSKESEESEE